MMLVEVTQVPVAALPVDEFKAHLRMGSGFAQSGLQDAVLEGFLRAAMAAIEARISKAILTRSFALTVEAWHDASAHALPLAPVSVINDVILVDKTDVAAVVAPSAYRLMPDGDRPSLRPSGACLPSIPQDGRAEVTFEAGFGATWAEVPSDLQQAMLLLAAHYYEYRDETSLQSGCMPFGVTSLIERYRPIRTRLGAGQ